MMHPLFDTTFKKIEVGGMHSNPKEELVFSEPWMARAFGLVVALSERGEISLKEFQTALIAAVGSYESGTNITDDPQYYTRWLEALVALLRERRTISDEKLSVRETAIVAEALERKEHQHLVARNPDGSLRIEPIVTT